MITQRYAQLPWPKKVGAFFLCAAMFLLPAVYFYNYFTPAAKPTNLSSLMRPQSMDHSQLEWLAHRIDDVYVIGGHGDQIQDKILIRDDRDSAASGLQVHWTPSALARHIKALNVPTDKPILLVMCRGGRGDNSFAHQLTRLVPHKVITSAGYMLINDRGRLSTTVGTPTLFERALPPQDLLLIEFQGGKITDRFEKKS